MDVAELTMSPYDARAAFKEYRGALKTKYSAEDKALLNAYRALSLRRRVIDIIGAMRQSGVDALHRPKLAIVRADVETVYCKTERDGGAQFSIENSPRHNAAADSLIRMPAGTFPVMTLEEWQRAPTYLQARVPTIPPRFRPEHALSNYFLLWEAEWRDVPKDPILLRHLGKNLYAVLAQWDLTPVEQAVLRTRRRG